MDGKRQDVAFRRKASMPRERKRFWPELPEDVEYLHTIPAMFSTPSKKSKTSMSSSSVIIINREADLYSASEYATENARIWNAYVDQVADGNPNELHYPPSPLRRQTNQHHADNDSLIDLTADDCSKIIDPKNVKFESVLSLNVEVLSKK